MTPAGGGAARLLPWIAASLAAAGLLLVFHQVVRGAVLQGELRQVAAVAYAGAVWRCKGVAVASDRDQCLVRAQHTNIVHERIVQPQRVGP